MSVKPVTYYTVVCDRCGKDGNTDEDYNYDHTAAAWNSAESALLFAEEWDDWLITEDDPVRHYCLDCWQWNEDEDAQVPKPIDAGSAA